jgi:glutamate racemase
MMSKELPIGFMDSGLGGLSVLREAIRIMPAEDFIYFGDSLHAPYGTKEQSVIRDLTFAVVDNLMKQGIKGLAVACNTATSAAVRLLRGMYPDLPIVGIEPAVKPAVVSSHGGRILVMATPMTIAQEKYHLLLEQYRDQADIVSVPCGGLMEFVEQGRFDGEKLDTYFRENLLPYMTDDTETIVLGCTHYPFLRPHLMEFLGDRPIRLIDGSLGTSMELKRRLKVKGLLREENRTGIVMIQNSSGSQAMIDRSYELLAMPF